MTLADLHSTWGWVSVWLAGGAGVIALVLAILKRAPGRWFAVLVGVVVVAMLAQVSMGLILFNRPGGAEVAGNQHLFYGVVVTVTFAFAYIYRAQFAKRPALSWGLLLLFVMGLGLRGISTFGQSFGG